MKHPTDTTPAARIPEQNGGSVQPYVQAIRCPDCDGDGFVDASGFCDLADCPACGGTGKAPAGVMASDGSKR